MGFALKARRPKRGAVSVLPMTSARWFVLWGFVWEHTEGILDGEDAWAGCTNVGHYVTAAKARALAARLSVLLRKRVVSAESRERQERTRRARRNVCPACRGRRIVLYRAVPHDVRARCGRCDGTGHPRAFPAFRTVWVREFRNFCETSGGFWIY